MQLIRVSVVLFLGFILSFGQSDILHQPIQPPHPLADVRNFSSSLEWKSGAAFATFAAPLWDEALSPMTGVSIWYRVNGGPTRTAAMEGSAGNYSARLTEVGQGDSVAYFFDQVLQGEKAPIHVNTAWFGRRLSSAEDATPAIPFAVPREFDFGVRFRDRHEDEWRYDHYVKGYGDSAFLFVHVKDFGNRLEMVFRTLKRSYYDSFRIYDHGGITPGYDLARKPASVPECERADPEGVTAIPDSTHTAADYDGYFSFHWTVEPVTYGQQLDFEWTNNILNADNQPQQYYSEHLRYYVGQGPQPYLQHPYANAAGPLSINKVSYRRFAFNQHLNAPLPATLTAFFGGKGIFDTDWERGVVLNPKTPNGCDLDHPAGEIYMETELPATPVNKSLIGPKFNNTSCTHCHFLDGRGTPEPTKSIPFPDAPYKSLLMRISVPGTDAHGGPAPHPLYGGQLREFAAGGSAGDGTVTVAYSDIPSGITGVTLRKPAYAFSGLTGEAIDGAKVMYSPRVAPQIPGLGLLAGVPEEEIRAVADAQARAGRVAGKPNRVWDAEKKALVLGRFGWKAGQPTLRQQAAAAAANDMGISNPLFPEADGHSEWGAAELDKLTAYLSNLALPPRTNWQDPEALAGKALFEKAQCGDCHVPVLHTTMAGYSMPSEGFAIQPFTDLLLHDMGEGLSDGRPEYAAGPRQWRTPPLWGIGMVEDVSQHTRYLHDGRARNLLEAILWHGGEAEASKQAVVAMSDAERSRLLAYAAYPFADEPATRPWNEAAATVGLVREGKPSTPSGSLADLTLTLPMGSVVFPQAIAGATVITIWDLRGRLVRRLAVSEGRTSWDGRDASGRAVGRGLLAGRPEIEAQAAGGSGRASRWAGQAVLFAL